jgi:hypothetical protein
LDEHSHQAGRGDRAHEQHGQEEQPAAQEDGGEQAVLGRAQLVAEHTDKPEERDAGERHQVETEPDQVSTLGIGLERFQADLGQGDTRHGEGGDQQYTEDDPGHGRRSPTPP